ncbi:dynein light intermediate chain (DLIC) domain-containing protein [Sarocladium implicatum]|nr:dynein light intermediate chain (DLIC) domain-containing protein [Sarocladium implicatum]
MAINGNRASIVTSGSGDTEGRNGEQKKNIWTSMLESVASGKRLPEKNLLVLGGTPETQRDFLESLSSAESKRNPERQKMPPIANNFALGYTYYDVLDADQDDTIARVSLYLLSQPSSEFASLISPLLKPDAIPHTALVILLDWAQPHLWLRQLWTWIQVLKAVMDNLGSEEQGEMDELMESWKLRGRTGGSTNLDGTPAATATGTDGDSSLPQGPGEWSDALGLPLCVVCQNAQRMEVLEKNQGWKEPDFDTVLQYLRTVLLRHGASLIYTSQNTPSQLPSLIHATLGITSLLKRDPLKHNVIDRDKIAVFPNWDSWGKIRVLGGTFEPEIVSEAWAEDIKLPRGTEPPTFEALQRSKNPDNGADEEREDGEAAPEPQVDINQEDSAIARYEDWCRDPASGGISLVDNAMTGGPSVNVDSDDVQVFLERQHKTLELYKAKAADKLPESGSRDGLGGKRPEFGEERSVREHIGPVQFNMGGIQVDADDMVQRIKDRNAHSSPDLAGAAEPDTGSTPGISKDMDNEQLKNFFSNLMTRKAGGDAS